VGEARTDVLVPNRRPGRAAGRVGRIKESWAKSGLANFEARTLGSAGCKVERPHRGESRGTRARADSSSERLLAACDDNEEQMASVQRMLDERDREEVGAWTKQDIDLDPAEQELLFPRQQGSSPGRGRRVS